MAVGMMSVAACATHNGNNGGGSDPQGAACMASADCATQFCQWADGHTCGDGSEGTCAPKMTNIVCPDIVDPVCGCNGQSYPNACYALTAGESVAYTGNCH